MEQYIDYLRDILENGTEHADRTETGTLRVFGRQLRFDLNAGFPLITTKRVWMHGVATELCWFLSGGTNIRPLLEQGVSIWTDWPLKRYRDVTGDDISQDDFEQRIIEDEVFASKWGELGPVYGKQWRHFEGPDGYVDQIATLVERLRESPGSRRHLVSAWHPAQTNRMALPPCHYAFQCFVEGEPGDGRLSLMWQQRSVDSFLGLPFNIASYALLTHMLAQQADLTPHQLIFNGGDCHIYTNHLDVVHEQLERTPHPLPTLNLTPRDSIFDYTIDDITIANYEHHPALRAPIAV
ncbi:thymidylate synthase [Longibacter salinarum]|uniref:Thymidylate synthase n=1 Tax=Longibacter salinarum TaxID=1850348 RepID=A0A2A8D0L7_9BACT|nr:thymidylate synthase [Longibacter salinarum]PEN14465.1 thymidylate synthase [Longibacter salinarum]